MLLCGDTVIDGGTARDRAAVLCRNQRELTFPTVLGTCALLLNVTVARKRCRSIAMRGYY